jgi:hypothetical protein
MAINPGYMGYAQLGGTRIRFTDGSVSVKQAPEMPDLVAGSWNRNSFYYGAVTIDGNLGGPVDDQMVLTTIDGVSFINWCIRRSGDCGLMPAGTSLDMYYHCAVGSTAFTHVLIPEIRANTLEINASAGDVVNFSVGFIGAKKATFNSVAPTAIHDIRKLYTWEKLNVAMTSPTTGVTYSEQEISSFSININNNATPAYSLGAADLYPVEVVPGVREISGSITTYNHALKHTTDSWAEYNNIPGTVTFDLGTPYTVNVMFSRVQPEPKTGAYTSTFAFTGIGQQNFDIA